MQSLVHGAYTIRPSSNLSQFVHNRCSWLGMGESGQSNIHLPYSPRHRINCSHLKTHCSHRSPTNLLPHRQSQPLANQYPFVVLRQIGNIDFNFHTDSLRFCKNLFTTISEDKQQTATQPLFKTTLLDHL